jgi:ribonuclease E
VPTGEAAARATVPYKPKIGDTRPAPSTVANAAGAVADPDAPAKGKRRRRRGGKGRGSGNGGGGAANRPVQQVAGDAAEIDPEVLARRRGRERKGRPVGRYLMCVHVRPHATQIAVLEGRALIEHYVSKPADDATEIFGNIYLGRVQNVLPGMEAAFVDIGTPKNAVLYKGDVQYDPEDIEEKGDVRIEQVLKAGQNIVCQVTKNPIGTKGARLTQEVSLPGRFVVLVPNSKTYGISKRLGDDERKRLRKVLDEVKPEQHGIIVRTAAEGANADELRRDVKRLLDVWEQIDALAKRSQAASLLYREPTMAVRVIRAELNRVVRGVMIEYRELYEEVTGYVVAVNPELADRVEFYYNDVEPLPMFERYHVHEELH